MNTKNWLFAGALSAAAAILYFASLAGYAFPGESAQLMVYWKGLDVPDAPVYPLMAFFAKLLGGGKRAREQPVLRFHLSLPFCTVFTS